MARLDNKVAIITGAGNGQGAYEAELFAKEGAKVVATDINFNSASTVVEEINNSQNGQAIAVKHDIANENEWKNVIEKTVESFGKVDILVNNAGIHADTAMADISLEEWNKIIQVNLTGTFIGMQAVIPEMKKNGAGSIVNIGSIAAMYGGSFAHYSAAKGGMRSLTKVAAIEYGKDNIRTNGVYPGLIETALTKDALDDEELYKKFIETTYLPRLGKVEDVAYGVLYLASDESSFVNGTELVIDGGTIAGHKLK
ncbi:SDR family NAD(P)-dependent oxidoreductase [Lentibacillus sediminis]|uniref:SDR family NAD(P)-dependent oxidoreductase n=1 Tax=Lentibacillus sediminis TaxID=1940529 RepID=UPI000C1BB07E|nr:glucose 1-dehydrogenase [Lentibacillus sediminis]